MTLRNQLRNELAAVIHEYRSRDYGPEVEPIEDRLADTVTWIFLTLGHTDIIEATNTTNGTNCGNCGCALAKDGQTWIHAYDGRRWCFDSTVAEPERAGTE